MTEPERLARALDATGQMHCPECADEMAADFIAQGFGHREDILRAFAVSEDVRACGEALRSGLDSGFTGISLPVGYTYRDAVDRYLAGQKQNVSRPPDLKSEISGPTSLAEKGEER